MTGKGLFGEGGVEIDLFRALRRQTWGKIGEARGWESMQQHQVNAILDKCSTDKGKGKEVES